MANSPTTPLPPEFGGPSAKSSPFVVYCDGTRYQVPNSIYPCATSALAMLDDLPMEEAFDRLRREGGDAALVAGREDVSQIWMRYFELFLKQGGEDMPPFTWRLEIFRRMATRPPEEVWSDLRSYIIENVDVLSGWLTSSRHLLAERDAIFRGDDGLYYRYADDGQPCQVIGATTLRETHMDFVTSHLLQQYGNLRAPLELLSLFMISDDFKRNSAMYPNAMNAVLSMPKWQVIRHQWALQHWDRTRTVKWRPHSNVCDPEWLAADLLGFLTDTLRVDAWQTGVRPGVGRYVTFNAPYERQMDCVLDCRLRIGDADEYSFEFCGRSYRWINGSLESDTIISVAMRRDEDSASVAEDLNRLLSLLAWGHRIPIARRTGATVIGAKRALPLISGTRSGVGQLVQPQWLFRYSPDRLSSQGWLALSFFREAMNARSVFYEFLNYWKSIEVVFPDVPGRCSWIDSNVDRLFNERDRIAEIRGANPSVASYLFTDGRCAVAHVNREPIINPDRAGDYERLERDTRIVAGLSKLAIESMDSWMGA